ncbi:MAG: hypothetical protein J6581_04030 [Apibacter sp.]|jgi:hypothetical protein|nr:hypothetical protein [Apibacter sp.]
MEIKVTVKQLGKKHPFLKEKTLKIKDIGSFPSLKTLLEAIVEQQVAEYNNKKKELDDNRSIEIPKNNYLPLLLDTGKVGFDHIYNLNKVDMEKAKCAAIQGFEDGLIAIFLDKEKLTHINQPVDINSQKTITFIRLTFLAGSYW